MSTPVGLPNNDRNLAAYRATGKRNARTDGQPIKPAAESPAPITQAADQATPPQNCVETPRTTTNTVVNSANGTTIVIEETSVDNACRSTANQTPETVTTDTPDTVTITSTPVTTDVSGTQTINAQVNDPKTGSTVTITGEKTYSGTVTENDTTTTIGLDDYATPSQSRQFPESLFADVLSALANNFPAPLGIGEFDQAPPPTTESGTTIIDEVLRDQDGKPAGTVTGKNTWKSTTTNTQSVTEESTSAPDTITVTTPPVTTDVSGTHTINAQVTDRKTGSTVTITGEVTTSGTVTEEGTTTTTTIVDDTSK